MMPNGWEWIIIVVVAFLLFGPKKLPELAKSVGQAIQEFKKSMSGSQESASPAKPDDGAPQHDGK
jgi:sec-independent protein translocase protein TatA